MQLGTSTMFAIRKSCSECIFEHELEVKIASASRSMFPAPIAHAHEATVQNLLVILFRIQLDHKSHIGQVVLCLAVWHRGLQSLHFEELGKLSSQTTTATTITTTLTMTTNDGGDDDDDDDNDHRRPTATNDDRRPSTTDDDRRRPTTADDDRRRPTTIDDDRLRATTTDDDRRRPTTTDND